MEEKQRKCLNCKNYLTPLKYRKFKCEHCGDTYKIKHKNIPDMTDSNNWKATCDECGGIMDYYNLKYCCKKCGNILEV